MKQIGFLAIVFAALLVAVIVKETSRPERGALRDQVPLVPVAADAFAPADARAVTVAGKDGAPLFEIERTADRWIVTKPFRAPAAAGLVLELTEAVSGARGEMRLDDRAALGKFHLADGQAPSVRITGEGGKLLAHVSIGKTSGTSGCFVRLLHDAAEGGRAYAVNADLRGALGLPRSLPGSRPSDDPEPDHFHDKNLPSLDVAEATQLTLETPLWRLVLERDEGEWAVAEGGPGVPLKAEAVERLVRQLRSSVAARALADPARRAALGLDSPGYRVTATLPDGAQRTLLGAADHEAQTFHARVDAEQDPDVVYELAGHQWGLIFPPGSGLFEFPRLSPEEDARAVIAITTDEGVIRMMRGPDRTWMLLEPDWGLRPDESRLRGLAGMLANLQPVDWLDGGLAPPGADEARTTVEYGPLGAPPEGRIVIGGASPAGRDRVAQLPSMPGKLVVLSDSTVDRIAPPLFDLFEPALLPDWDELDVTRISVRPIAGSGTPFEVARKDEGWTLRTVGAESPADRVAVDDWVARLVGVRAAGVEEAPGEPTHALVLERADGERAALGMRPDGAAGYVVFTGKFGGERQVRKAFRVSEGDLLPEVDSLERTAPAEDGGEEEE